MDSRSNPPTPNFQASLQQHFCQPQSWNLVPNYSVGNVSPQKMELLLEIQKKDQIIMEQHASILKMEEALAYYRHFILLAMKQQQQQLPQPTLQEPALEIFESKPDSAKQLSKGNRYWTTKEHEMFLEGLKKYNGNKPKLIAKMIGTRTAAQVRSHAQKYFLRQKKEESHFNNLTQDTESEFPTEREYSTKRRRDGKAEEEDAGA